VVTLRFRGLKHSGTLPAPLAPKAVVGANVRYQSGLMTGGREYTN